MKNNILKGIIKWLVSLVIIALSYWFMLPPINWRSREFWTFLIWSVIVCVAINAFTQIFDFIKANVGKKIKIDSKTHLNLSALGAPIKFAVITIVAIIVLSGVASIIGAEIFNAKSYNNLIKMSDGDFTKDVAEINMDQIPIVDRDTASRLAQRKLGEMSDLVSQFEIEDIYTQINYRGKPVRVTPLIYGDIIKWLNNQKQGIPAYITIDMTTQETSLVRLEKGIKYSESEYFMRDLNRALRFKYPTKIFGDISFEIDDDGTPYWVASTVTYRIGVWSGQDINGAVLLNAITGESKYYALKDIPTWVDQVFESDMVIQQLVYNGKYRSGFWNSVFGQRGVLQPTDGYNYLAIDDDVYLYTGMTSVTSDESNVGFVLTNLRTKETKFYAIPGAEEYSAMSSAEGQVQHLNYTSTFPLLLNVSNRPTYFMSLKDAAGLVKMYAFVDVNQYQIVGTGNSVEAAQSDYISKLKDENVSEDIKPETASGVIEKINAVVIEGNTVYYIKLQDNDAIYTAKVTVSDMLPFTEKGASVTLTLNGKTITKIEYK
ncbi:MAG: CvpA family protein [Ruminococcaceae bacterium]|nr:CvpA family protein [Oscillospiraceae bacterium]